jgi:hypothetical protein
VVGAGLAGYLIYDAVQSRDFAAKIQDASPPALQYFTSLQDERRLTLQQIAGGPSDRAAVVEQRAVVDAAAGQVLDAVSRLEGEGPATAGRWRGGRGEAGQGGHAGAGQEPADGVPTGHPPRT